MMPLLHAPLTLTKSVLLLAIPAVEPPGKNEDKQEDLGGVI